MYNSGSLVQPHLANTRGHPKRPSKKNSDIIDKYLEHLEHAAYHASDKIVRHKSNNRAKNVKHSAYWNEKCSSYVKTLKNLRVKKDSEGINEYRHKKREFCRYLKCLKRKIRPLKKWHFIV